MRLCCLQVITLLILAGNASASSSYVKDMNALASSVNKHNLISWTVMKNEKKFREDRLRNRQKGKEIEAKMKKEGNLSTTMMLRSRKSDK
jgi:hypothetical protein